jgi:hypothetical protein
LVNHGGLTMVNVGDDGDVTDLFMTHGGLSKTSKTFLSERSGGRQDKAGGSSE